jgi:hypothetical protein
MHKRIALLPVLILGGCATSGERIAATCRAHGYLDGTVGFESCRQSLEHAMEVAHADQAEADARWRTPSLVIVHH